MVSLLMHDFMAFATVSSFIEARVIVIWKLSPPYGYQSFTATKMAPWPMSLGVNPSARKSYAVASHPCFNGVRLEDADPTWVSATKIGELMKEGIAAHKGKFNGVLLTPC